jgi:hypothetical protein
MAAQDVLNQMTGSIAEMGGPALVCDEEAPELELWSCEDESEEEETGLMEAGDSEWVIQGGVRPHPVPYREKAL